MHDDIVALRAEFFELFAALVDLTDSVEHLERS